jgi:O-antigen ligase
VGVFVALLLVWALRFAPGRTLFFSALLTRGVMLAAVAVLAASLCYGDRVLRLMQLDRFTEAAKPTEQRGTAYWRWVWWQRLGHEVMKQDPAFGLGFGESLNVYNPFLEGNEHTAWPVRSPHNYNITIFSRMGLVGAALWVSILALGIGGLYARIWRGRWRGRSYTPERREELAFWVLCLVTTWGNATFGVLMEGPVLGIWFWFALGFAFQRSRSTGEPEESGVPADHHRWVTRAAC